MNTQFAAVVSSGLVSWMLRHDVSLACSSYQTGRLLFIGSSGKGDPVFAEARFQSAMGLVASSQRLYLAGGNNIWRLENTLGATELAENRYDRLFVPRGAHVINNIRVHELALEASGRLVFVNTKYSCLATVSNTHSFQPVWKPAFITRLAAEDRCHLNGVGLDQGQVRYVTACATTDVAGGWRDHRRDGGVLIDTWNECVIADGLSMPHSPRAYGGSLWLHESGSGYLCRIDPQTRRRERVVFCPGLLRGLTFVADYALMTLSLPRKGVFQGLPLDDELKRRAVEPSCGLMVVDIRNGDLIAWVRFETDIVELFDVAVVPGARCPTAIAPNNPALSDAITFDEDLVPATRGASLTEAVQMNV
jgi:uncharacterized protein (TIGR03032 family)